MGREMVRLLKIFGLASLGLVLLLSLFNERRANNTGEDPSFRLSDSGMLFFKNIRRIDYAVRSMPDAGIDIYTHKGFDRDSTQNTLILEIIVHKNRNTASPYLLSAGQLKRREPLLLHAIKKDDLYGTLEISTGDRYVHLEQAGIIFNWLSSEIDSLKANVGERWIPLLDSKREREAFVNSYNDFLKITGQL
ncbi:hypothetical protein SAMN04488057_102484 [Cyclobacterium lianum]|uniref:Uncharacterized protein n=2 Tax=Cyclobacterium lianum TaxID=388280 RepID=A0A1M7KJ18_9BACT|nr:hypothetical protein SAMN04488057_102484 [Cyclobacterium lianum]